MPMNWPNNANPAVTILGNNPAVHNRVVKSLNKINQTPAGLQLFNGLRIARAMGKNVAIQIGGASSCASGGGGPLTRTLLAQAILDQNGNVGAEIQNALNAIPAANPNPHQWLANAMNACPYYTLQGAVNMAPSNLNVTPLQVQNWIAGLPPFPQPFPAGQYDQLKNVLLTVLWPGSRQHPGPGSGALVTWNPASAAITLTTGLVMNRSKSIGLAHELIHAYYNVFGLQMGIDNGHASTAIYEYMCVGLGPWAAEPISENQIRAGWQGVVKTIFGGMAQVHYAAVPARPAY